MHKQYHVKKINRIRTEDNLDSLEGAKKRPELCIIIVNSGIYSFI